MLHWRKMRPFFVPNDCCFWSSPLMNMTIPYWPEFNSARFCWSVACCLWLTDVALQEAVGSSSYSWAGQCLQRREGETPGCAASIINTPVCVWEGSYSSTEQRVQRKLAREEDGGIGGKEAPGLCISSLLFCSAPRVFWTQPVLSSVGCCRCWRRSLGPVCSTRARAPVGLCVGFESGELWGGIQLLTTYFIIFSS